MKQKNLSLLKPGSLFYVLMILYRYYKINNFLSETKYLMFTELDNANRPSTSNLENCLAAFSKGSFQTKVDCC